MKNFILLLALFACEHNSNPVSKIVDSISTQSADTKTSDPQILSVSEAFMELINDHRRSLGLNPLISDSSMDEIATKHSEDMASHLIPFGHLGFSLRCSEARSALGGGNLCAENVAEGQDSAQSVYNAWMNSPGHRANIENIRVTHSGFGFKQDLKGTYYWTHIFLER